MNWNLIFTEINNNNAKIELFLNNEPIIKKEFFKQIIEKKSKRYVTYVETGLMFNNENFTQFINSLKNNISAKFYFDDCDGEETFVYDAKTEKFEIYFELYSSNLSVSIPMDEQKRLQFTDELQKFLTFSMDVTLDLDMPTPHILN